MNTNITGAGVILIENYRINNKYEPCVILFRNGISGKYSDAGGFVDRGETVKQAAARELKEESLNLFRINPNKLKYAVTHQSYMCYFLGIRGPIFSTYYHHNRKILHSPRVPPEWRETDDMIRITIQQFIKSGGLVYSGDIATMDTKGNRVIILGRTKACIREAIRQTIIKMILKNSFELNKNVNYTDKRGLTFLNGTKTYWL